MDVHSPRVDALERGMHTCTTPATLPFEAGDSEWVADLFETLGAGELDVVVDQLDGLVLVMRKAAQARRILATVEPDKVRAGLQVQAARRGGS